MKQNNKKKKLNNFSKWTIIICLLLSFFTASLYAIWEPLNSMLNKQNNKIEAGGNNGGGELIKPPEKLLVTWPSYINTDLMDKSIVSHNGDVNNEIAEILLIDYLVDNMDYRLKKGYFSVTTTEYKNIYNFNVTINKKISYYGEEYLVTNNNKTYSFILRELT